MIATETATIRPARLEDLPEVTACIIALRQETLWKDVPFTPNPVYILGWLLEALMNPVHQLFIAEADGEIIGACGGELLTPRFIPDVLYVQEWLWYVKPAHRENFVKIQLLLRLYRWAKQQGAKGGVAGRLTPHGEELRWTPFYSV